MLRQQLQAGTSLATEFVDTDAAVLPVTAARGNKSQDRNIFGVRHESS